jgi:hypothetical protein
MRSPLLLTFRAYRKQSCWFVDHDDGIIQMNNFEAMALKGVVAHSLPYRNGHDVVRPQLGIMPDPRLVLYRHRSEPEKVFRLFARQSQRQANQIWQEFASGGDTKLIVVRHHARFFSLCFDRTLYSLTAHCFRNNSARQELHQNNPPRGSNRTSISLPNVRLPSVHQEPTGCSNDAWSNFGSGLGHTCLRDHDLRGARLGTSRGESRSYMKPTGYGPWQGHRAMKMVRFVGECGAGG